MTYSLIEHNIDLYKKTLNLLCQYKDNAQKESTYLVAKKINTLSKVTAALKATKIIEVDKESADYQLFLDIKDDKHSAEDNVLINELMRIYDFDSARCLRIQHAQDVIFKAQLVMDACTNTESHVMTAYQSPNRLYTLVKLCLREKGIEELKNLNIPDDLYPEIREEAKYQEFNFDKFIKIRSDEYKESRLLSKIKQNNISLFAKMLPLTEAQLNDLLKIQEQINQYEESENYLISISHTTKYKFEMATALITMQRATEALLKIERLTTMKGIINDEKFNQIKNGSASYYSSAFLKKHTTLGEVLDILKKLSEEEIRELKLYSEAIDKLKKAPDYLREKIISRGNVTKEQLKKMGLDTSSSMTQFLQTLPGLFKSHKDKKMEPLFVKKNLTLFSNSHERAQLKRAFTSDQLTSKVSSI